MSRLTKEITAYGKTYNKCNMNGCPEYECTDCHHFYEMLAKLKHYEDLEEQGRLIELPCAVGDTVWELHAVDDFYAVAPHRINSLAYCMLTKNRFGESVFLTKEEAEAKLKELKGE